YLSICFVPLKYSNPILKESSMLSIISWIVGSSSFLVSLLLLIPSRLTQLRNVLLWSLYGFLPLLLIYVSKSSILESMTCFPYSSINRLYSSFFNRTLSRYFCLSFFPLLSFPFLCVLLPSSCSLDDGLLTSLTFKMLSISRYSSVTSTSFLRLTISLYRFCIPFDVSMLKLSYRCLLNMSRSKHSETTSFTS